MINLKAKIVKAFESNQVLFSLLGGPRVYHLKAPKAEEFPRITFFELTNINDAYADDLTLTTEIHIQIDIWSKKSTSAIVAEVDKTMRVLSFKRNSTADLYEDDAQIYHYVVRYQTIIIKEDELGSTNWIKRSPYCSLS